MCSKGLGLGEGEGGRKGVGEGWRKGVGRSESVLFKRGVGWGWEACLQL